MTPYPLNTSTSESDRVTDLLSVIREETTISRDLVDRARRKSALLTDGGVDAILESNKVEEALCSRLRTLESERRRLSDDLRQAFRIPSEGFTLTKLADRCERSLALEFLSQASLFRSMMKELKSVAQRNVRLIEKSIHYSRGLLALFSHIAGAYQPNGLIEPVSSVQPTFSERA